MTTAELDFLIESAAVAGQIAAGANRSVVASRSTNRRLALVAMSSQQKKKRGLAWTQADDDFLRAHHGQMPEDEIAHQLGRTPEAVHLRRERGLRLPAPSKGPNVFSLEQVATGLGRDSHYTARLVNRGFMPARELPFMRRGRTGRRVRVIDRLEIIRFCVNPLHWMMFDPEQLGRLPAHTRGGHVGHFDPAWWARLRSLVLRRRAGWDDEWWSPGQVANYLSMSISGVNKAIRQGRLPAVRWGNWWVLRSDATRPGLKLMAWSGKGGAGQDHMFTSPEADAFIVLAAAVGLPHVATAALMKREPKWVAYRLHTLKSRGRLAWIVRAHKLPVIFNRTGHMLADWKKLKQRFPHLAHAMAGLRRGEELSQKELLTVRAVLFAWARFFARAKAQQRLACNLGTFGNRRAKHFLERYRQLRAAGIDPYQKLGAA